jgi:predicted nucleic acid-binding protein
VTRAVYDCNVLVSGIGWAGSARACLKLVAERRVFAFITDAILAEYESTIPEILSEEVSDMNPYPKLAWIKSKFISIKPLPLGKRRSRDPKDDMYLGCALAACDLR